MEKPTDTMENVIVEEPNDDQNSDQAVQVREDSIAVGLVELVRVVEVLLVDKGKEIAGSVSVLCEEERVLAQEGPSDRKEGNIGDTRLMGDMAMQEGFSFDRPRTEEHQDVVFEILELENKLIVVVGDDRNKFEQEENGSLQRLAKEKGYGLDLDLNNTILCLKKSKNQILRPSRRVNSRPEKLNL